MNDTKLIDMMTNDGLTDAFYHYHMGITAENVAEQWNLTREDLDAFAAASQQKACKAVENGKFSLEIVPVTVRLQKGEIVVNKDESPRIGITLESLARLRPAFKDGGVITAGNSSGINDGAASVVLVSETKVKELNLMPMAEWMGGALCGVDPSIMGIGPVASTNKLLKKLNISMSAIDLVEANEAFAAQSLAVKQELGITDSKLNVNGGAIALGHPVGASGCRILVTLLYEMMMRKATLGLATLCVGGGMGCSTVIRRYSWK